jgi:2-dehydro-3-deoxyphosphogluconate aldolase/(4S)-4-hydroxy-2-oxoglutarate aldolase
MTTLDDVFGAQRVMAILRGLPPEETVALAGKLWDLGLTVLEVPIGRPEQVAALSAAVRAGAARGRLVGAGTVVSVEQVKAAAAAGATYTVAPGLDVDVLAASHAAGLPHLPGVATATEVQRARAAGSSWVKAFPAVALGPVWFDAMRGPFPDVSFVATGGVTAVTARAFLDAGARVVALGTALADPEQVALLDDLL